MVEIEVEISPSGEVQVHVKGVKGKQCLSITNELESLLGGDVSREFTEEYDPSATTKKTEREKTVD
ncbi:MAG: DUF2997 domain-containing protein [Candidatus Obscuribacterales bacterium]|nr:DUF2997 domain-containing protein [Candidatus Obscuribacterales bacterium]